MPKPLLPRDLKLGAIVLAAGGSSRLGRPKQLLRLGQQPLIVCAVKLAREICNERTIVVIGAESLRMRACLRRHCHHELTFACNARWRQGLAGSLLAGLARMPSGVAGVLVLLVDQPGVTAEDLARLIRAWAARPRRAVAAEYAGRPGVPAIIPRQHWPALRALSGDTGARAFLRGLEDLVCVPMPSAAFDVDVPEDAARLAGGLRRTAFGQRSDAGSDAGSDGGSDGRGA